MHLISEMGKMKSLGTLNASKNRITQIPLALAASTSIMELFLNDNCLVEIPAKVMAMKSLKVFEAERKLNSLDVYVCLNASNMPSTSFH